MDATKPVSADRLPLRIDGTVHSRREKSTVDAEKPSSIDPSFHRNQVPFR